MIVNDLLRRGVKLYPDRGVMRYQDKDMSYRELNLRVNRLAGSMLKMGIRQGDRIAILAANSNAYLEVCLACGKIGVVFIPLNARLKGDELKYIIKHGKAKALFTIPPFVELVASMKGELPIVEHFICIGQPAEGYGDYEALLSESTEMEPDVQVTESDVFCQMYTSGTTGLPKGAMLTHRNLLSVATACCLEHDIKAGDKYLMVMPLFHVGGLVPALSALIVGAKLFVYPTFDPQEVLRAISENKITHAALVAAMILFVLSVPDAGSHDFSKLKYIVYGGSPISPDLLKQAMTVFKCDFIQGYGLTEAASFATLLRPEDHVLDGTPEQLKRLTSAGKEMLGIEVKVVDEQGEEVKAGDLGEIIIKGENNMLGYWEQPEETTEALRNGWFYSGDMGTVDDEGYIFILERKKDMIISGGENIYSREIEDVLASHPAVAEGSIIGVPDEVWGESVKAVIVVKEGESVTEQEIIDFCASKLAGYKKPKSVDILTELPRTPAGKVLKRLLRDPYWEGHDRGVH
ncbi:MAG: long-chain-fatty-acid--CoA ligase [Deltaproteobacteria bacterium]|jgi:long-chain acyl-CoA synthetase|nr:long-chain-fatty-acid--CoA ligase [Deltaproteobacteria bacterium]